MYRVSEVALVQKLLRLKSLLLQFLDRELKLASSLGGLVVLLRVRGPRQAVGALQLAVPRGGLLVFRRPAPSGEGRGGGGGDAQTEISEKIKTERNKCGFERNIRNGEQTSSGLGDASGIQSRSGVVLETRVPARRRRARRFKKKKNWQREVLRRAADQQKHASSGQRCITADI